LQTHGDGPGWHTDGHIYATHAKLIVEFADHELDARDQAVGREPVLEWVDVGALKKSSMVLNRRSKLSLVMAIPGRR